LPRCGKTPLFDHLVPVPVLKIGIDGRCLRSPRAGVGRYVWELCRALDRILPDANFYVYNNRPVELPVQSPRWIPRQDPSSVARHLKGTIWLKLMHERLCRADRLDVYWAPATILPRLPRQVRTVSTVHDLNYLIVPGSMRRSTLWIHSLFLRRDLLRADRVVVNSSGTAHRLRQYLGLTASAVAQPAVDRTTFYRPAAKRITDVLHAYKIRRPYFLAVSKWEPRKNLALLLRVFVALSHADERMSRYQLVLAGARGWKDRQLAGEIAGAPRDSVLPLGHVPDTDLAALYAGCHAFVFPSVYEGFGIPVLEARACGARILASDVPEIREAGGSSATYIEPTWDRLTDGLLTMASAPPPQVS